MKNYSESKGASIVRQICRWALPAMCLLTIAYWTIFYVDRDFYIDNAGVHKLVTGVGFIVLFTALALLTPNRSLMVGCLSFVSANAIELLPLIIKLQFQYFDFICYTLARFFILFGIIIICSDKNLFARIPKLGLTYIFLLAASVIIYMSYRYLLSSPELLRFSSSINNNPLLLIDGAFVYLINFVELLFWFNLLKSPCSYHTGAKLNPLKQPALLAVFTIAVLYFLFFTVFK